MGLHLGAFLGALQMVLPMALATVGVPPVLTATVLHAAVEAEHIHGDGTGASKLAHVQAIVTDAANVFNATKSVEEQINVSTLNDAVASGIAAGVKAANVIKDLHKDVAVAQGAGIQQGGAIAIPVETLPAAPVAGVVAGSGEANPGSNSANPE